MHPKPQKILSVFALAMISVAAIVNLRNIPLMATQGFSSVFFYGLAVLVFLIPTGLVCSELASTFPEAGGVYMWVKKAFGDKVGFFSIWSEWFNNVIGFPATISFIAATIAYVFIPNLNQHKYVLMGIMLIILWSCTLFNFLGIKASSRLNIVGAISGTIIPGIVIIILGLVWLLNGHPIQINFSTSTFFPPPHISNVVFFLGVLSGYAGMQVTAFHAQNVKNPRRDYPRAIILATLMIMALTIFGSLAIAIVVPKEQISLVAGIIQGFSGFFSAFHMNWALPVLALLIAVSGISTLSAWLLAPARGLAIAAQQGHFPKWCAYENRQNMPTHILLLQAIMSTCLSFVFFYADSLSTALWMLMVLTSQFTLIMDILIFSSVIKLRYSHKNIQRPFKVPGGKLGLWLIPGISILICLMGIALGYFPPAELHIGKLWQYEAFLLAGNIIYVVLPFIIFRVTKKQNTTL